MRKFHVKFFDRRAWSAFRRTGRVDRCTDQIVRLAYCMIVSDGRPLARCTSTLTHSASMPASARLRKTARLMAFLMGANEDPADSKRRQR